MMSRRKEGFGVLLLLHTLILLLEKVSCTGLFELQLTSFRNDHGLNSDGNCCNGLRTNGRCTSTCKTFFRICLTHYQATISTDNTCTFGSVTTPVFGNNSVDFNKLPTGSINPIKFNIEVSWPGTFSLIVEAWHDSTLKGPTNGSPRELISRLAVQRSLKVNDDWSHYDHRQSSTNTDLRYSYRFVCAEHYYGPGCSDYCRPRDDKFGHYTCRDEGDLVCLDGWKGPYCDQAICMPGCHSDHGYCDKPYECRCRHGWRGPQCDECIEYPGCDTAHGTCEKPWECICREGWGGLYCNQDLNYCTHNLPCKNGATCTNTGQGSYTCACPASYVGTNCEIEVDDCEVQPCLNGGTCMDIGTGYKCKCPLGYNGRRCHTKADSCSNDPCKNGATCIDGDGTYSCECAGGFTGVNCDMEINECSPNPCLNNGRCIDEIDGFRCDCTSGYSGQLCEVNFNDCRTNPCLNRGVCVDKVNDFECRCVPGYVGALCQTNVDDCLMMPCANGATCHDMENDVRCTCAPGYTGKHCNVNVNECASSPCLNNGECMDGVNEFKCRCRKGFWGKRCQYQEGVPIPITVPTEGVSIPITVPATTRHTITTGEQTDSSNINDAISMSDEDDSLTMKQLLLIVCLGAGIPLVSIIVFVAFLLYRKRRRLQEEDMSKEQEQNVVNSMNNKNKCIESNIFTTIPPGGGGGGGGGGPSLKVTNEEKDFNNTYFQKQLFTEKSTHKHLINKDFPTSSSSSSSSPPSGEQHFHKVRDFEKPSLKLDPDLQLPDPMADVREYHHPNPNIQVIVKPLNTDTQRNSIFYLEQSHRHPYSDGVLATEV